MFQLYDYHKNKVLVQEPIDMSNTNIDVGKVCLRIAPCTSVLNYRDDYLKQDSFIQDF